jgi:hypothetical protein
MITDNFMEKQTSDYMEGGLRVRGRLEISSVQLQNEKG